jgi:drug/metabolite transporter (DMT)-like permease
MGGAFDRDPALLQYAHSPCRATIVNRTALLLLCSSLLFASASVAVKACLADRDQRLWSCFFQQLLRPPRAHAPLCCGPGPNGLRNPVPAPARDARHWRVLAAHVLASSNAISHLPLGEAMLLNYSSPLFIPFIGPALAPRGAAAEGLRGRSARASSALALILKPGERISSRGGAGAGCCRAC